jgi:trk system potassium uptake protein TrkA
MLAAVTPAAGDLPPGGCQRHPLPSEDTVHVVIMGCGRVGSTLAKSLAEQGHSVSVIDSNPDSFRRLGSAFTGSTVTGVGFDREVLMAAGIERADGFAAVSSGDNSNIISARLARETFGVPRVVARIYDSKRAEVYERLGIPTVATVRWTADRMLRHLIDREGAEVWRDQTRTVSIVEVSVRRAGSASRSATERPQVPVAYLLRLGAARLPTAPRICGGRPDVHAGHRRHPPPQQDRSNCAESRH